MATNNANPGPTPFWDFIQAFDANAGTRAPGEGVDSHGEPRPAFPLRDLAANWAAWAPYAAASWGGSWGPWGPSGRPGRGGRHGGGGFSHQPWRSREWNEEEGQDHPEDDQAEAGNNEAEGSPAAAREDPCLPPPPHHGPPPAFGFPGHPHPPPHHFPHHPSPGGPHRRGSSCRRSRGRGRGGFGGNHGHPWGPPHPGFGPPFNFPPGMWPALRQFAEQFAGGREEKADDGDNVALVPPCDVFDRPTEWQVHVALPGAKKDDIGVKWDADMNTLTIAGVIHRPGDEEFQQSLTSICERKLGFFERTVKLPTADGSEKDEADGEGISARFEDGLLVVTVPKVERDWTEVRTVDIE